MGCRPWQGIALLFAVMVWSSVYLRAQSLQRWESDSNFIGRGVPNFLARLSELELVAKVQASEGRFTDLT